MLGSDLVGFEHSSWSYHGAVSASTFDPKRAWLKGPDFFARFEAPASGEPLREQGLDGERQLVIAERGGARRAFIADELSVPHMAQGELGGEPYLVSF